MRTSPRAPLLAHKLHNPEPPHASVSPPPAAPCLPPRRATPRRAELLPIQSSAVFLATPPPHLTADDHQHLQVTPPGLPRALSSFPSLCLTSLCLSSSGTGTRRAQLRPRRRAPPRPSHRAAPVQPLHREEEDDASFCTVDRSFNARWLPLRLPAPPQPQAQHHQGRPSPPQTGLGPWVSSPSHLLCTAGPARFGPRIFFSVPCEFCHLSQKLHIYRLDPKVHAYNKSQTVHRIKMI